MLHKSFLFVDTQRLALCRIRWSAFHILLKLRHNIIRRVGPDKTIPDSNLKCRVKQSMYPVNCRYLYMPLIQEIVVIGFYIGILYIYYLFLSKRCVFDISFVGIYISAFCSKLKISLLIEVILDHVIYFNCCRHVRIEPIKVIALNTFLFLA